MSLSNFSMALAGVSTARPVIADGASVRVRFVKVDAVQKDKGTLLQFEYHLLEPAPTSEGKTLPAGFKLIENISLYGKDTPPGQIPEWAESRTARIIDAFLGTGDADNDKGKPTRPELNEATSAELIGKECWIKVRVGKDQDGAPQNELGSKTFPGDIKV